MGNEKVLDSDISAYSELVDTDKYGEDEEKLFSYLNGTIIGQNRASRHLADAFTIRNAGLSRPGKPIATKLFVGPTGVGKTEMAEQIARYFIPVPPGAPAPVTRIDCADLQEPHAVSSVLLGSPPGYVGYNEPPRLSQYKLDEPHFVLLAEQFIAERFKDGKRPKDMERFMEKLYEHLKPLCISFVIFDEVEKAHANLWDLLLGITDKARAVMKNGQITSFENTVLILTSNVNGRNYQRMLTGKRVGFAAMAKDILDAQDVKNRNQQMYRETLAELKRVFKPEFVGRVKGDVVQFHPLSREHCREILGNKLATVQTRLTGKTANSVPLTLQFTPEFKEYILDEGVSVEYGVRELETAVRDNVERLIAKALSSNELWPGDEVLFTLDAGMPVIRRKKRTVAQKEALAAIPPAPTVILNDPVPPPPQKPKPRDYGNGKK
jgi:ATP-dependent Clp protease ATP-binding subunit ClpA